MKLQPNTQIKYSNTRHLSKYLFKVVLTGSNRHYIQSWRARLDGTARPISGQSPEAKRHAAVFAILQGKDVAMRCEWRGAFVYTNDKDVVEQLVSIWDTKAAPTVYLPLSGENNELPPDTVVLKRKIPYKFRVTIEFSSGARDFSEFVDWCSSVSDQVKMSSWSKQSLKLTRYYRSPIRIYVRDERTISMLRLLMGNQVSKVETITFL